MDINVAVNEALKAEISKAVSKELAIKKIDVSKEVQKYLTSAKISKLIADKMREDFQDWFDDINLFEDIPDKLMCQLMDKALKAILK